MHSSSVEFMHITQIFFFWFPVAIFVPRKGTPTWRLHTKLSKSGENVFPNILLMNYCTDLILGKAFCIFIFFHFPDAELSVLTGLHLYF